MKISIVFIVSLFKFFSFAFLTAQEINCEIVINTNQLRNYDVETRLQPLANLIRNYLNEYRWTTNTEFISPEDKITCYVDFSIINADLTKTPSLYTATVALTVFRSVFRSRSQVVLMKILDPEFVFSFDPQSTVLLHNDLIYQNSISSFLDFYANIMLGFDADSFKLLSGTEYFQKAQRIQQTLLQSEGSLTKGWSVLDGENSRGYFCNELILDKSTEFRKQTYIYHYEGLDMFYDNVEKGYAKIISVLEYLELYQSKRQDRMLLRKFFDAKFLEIIQLLKKAPSSIFEKAKPILYAADPTRQSTYDRYFSDPSVK